MNATPKVSVIIPNYNTPQNYLCTSINSVLASEGVSFEVIIVNDGSTDNSLEFITKEYGHNPLIKIINQKNKGLSGARNSGIKNAKGEYIAILDSDDYYYPTKLMVQSNYLDNNPGIDAVYSKTCLFSNSTTNNLKVIDHLQTPNDNILYPLLNGNFIQTDTFFVRKKSLDVINYYDEKLRELEDWDLYIRLSLNNFRFHYIDKILSLHRIHGTSMVTNQLKMNNTMIAVLKKHIPTLLNRNLKKEATRATHTMYNLRLKTKLDSSFTHDVFNEYKTLGLFFFIPSIKILLKRFIPKIRNKDSLLLADFKEIWNQ